MKKAKYLLLVAWPFLLVALVGIAIFAPVLGVMSAQIAPDSMPYFSTAQFMRQVEIQLGNGGSAPPSLLYWLVFPPLVAHEMTYLIDSLLVATAAALYLRTRKVAPSLAWLGGAALGFSGYSFTLVSAGHRGYFHMMACTVFAFPLVSAVFADTRPFSRRWPAYALLGLALGWGMLTQPDVFILVAALAAAYVLWLTFRRSAVSGLENEACPHRLRRVWPAFVITLAALLLAGGGIFHDLAYRFIPDRLAQIHGTAAKTGTDPDSASEKTGTDPEKSGPVPNSDSGKSGSVPGKSAEEMARENWIFATNWSLPPEDALEFVAPCVRGIETSDYPPGRNYPYWGRLGRTWEWEKHHQGFPNFRQHTVYLGAAQVFFAILAVVAWFKARRRGDGLPPWLRDVPFWAAAAIIATILSFGRYTPIYRLFYAIPGMNLLRAPVKLHHITEICTAILFGLGLASAFQTGTDPVSAMGTGPEKSAKQTGTGPEKSGPVPIRIAGLCLALIPGVALVAASVAVRGGPSGLIENWKALGYPARVAEVFLPRMAGALLHGGLLWFAGVAVWLLAKRGGMARTAAAALAWLCVGGDLVAVARNYINPMDVTHIYRENALSAAMQKDKSIGWPTLAQFITNPTDPHDVLSLSITSKGMCVAARSSHQHAAAAALQRRPDVLLDVMAADYVLVPEAQAKQFPLSKFQPVERINVGAMLGAGRDFQALLFKRRTPLQFAKWFTAWESVPADGQTAAAMRPGWDPARQLLVDAPAPEGKAEEGDARVEVESVRFFWSRSMDNVIRTHAKDAGMLAVRQLIDLPLEAFVDGEPAPLYRCDCVWTAVPVPGGDHTVVVRRKRGGSAPLWLGAASLAAMAVSLVALARSTRYA